MERRHRQRPYREAMADRSAAGSGGKQSEVLRAGYSLFGLVRESFQVFFRNSAWRPDVSGTVNPRENEGRLRSGAPIGRIALQTHKNAAVRVPTEQQERAHSRVADRLERERRRGTSWASGRNCSREITFRLRSKPVLSGPGHGWRRGAGVSHTGGRMKRVRHRDDKGGPTGVWRVKRGLNMPSFFVQERTCRIFIRNQCRNVYGRFPVGRQDRA
jgi:hypothetical protein